MPNEEILKYIKDCLSKNYTKEQIKQSLIQAGWGNSQIEEALLSVQNTVATVSTPPLPKETSPVINSYAPEKDKVSIAKEFAEAKPAVSSRSILPLAIIAGTAVIIVGIGITFWILTKNTVSSSQLATDQSASSQATTTNQNSQLAQQVEVKSATSTQTQLSEIDKYGVDLYTLKQGETKITAEVSNKSTAVTYTRKDKIVERCVSGGCSEIDLNARANLETKLAELDATIKSKCTAGSTHPDCSSAPLIYKEMKTCSSFQKSEDISRCTTQAMLKGFGGAYNQPVEPVVSKEVIPFNRTSAEKELSSLAEEGRLPSVVAKAEEEQSKICIGGRKNTIDCVQGRLMLSAVKSNCSNLTDIQKTKACIPAAVSALEKMVNDYNNSK